MKLKVALLVIPLLSACAWQDDKSQSENEATTTSNQSTTNPRPATNTVIKRQRNISTEQKEPEAIRQPELRIPVAESKASAEADVKAPVSQTNKPKAESMADNKITEQPQLQPQLQPQPSKQTAQSSATEQQAIPLITATATINGRVAFLQSSPTKAPPKDAIITLTRLDKPNTVNQQPAVHTVDMTDKTYLPGAIAINTGDVLAFNNNDPIKHNVFSSSGDNTFDLGTYGFNTQRQQVINAGGVVKIYCNIHPEMALFVMANNGEFSAITDDSGAFSFTSVPPGNYLLDVWHVRGAIDKKIVVTAGALMTEEIVIDTARYAPKPHLNKFGEPYKKQPAILSDEFY